MFSPYDLIFVASYIFFFSQFQVNSRRKMFLVRLTGVCFSITYFTLMGLDAAQFSALIAATGILFQVSFPDHLLKKTRLARCMVAVALAITGMFLVAENMTDLLPLFGVAGARLVEVQACPQRIRLGSLFSQMCWFFYAIQTGFIVMFIGETLSLFSNLSSIWRHEQKRKKLVTAPAAAS